MGYVRCYRSAVNNTEQQAVLIGYVRCYRSAVNNTEQHAVLMGYVRCYRSAVNNTEQQAVFLSLYVQPKLCERPQPAAPCRLTVHPA
jgi:hypothetical protein